MGLKERRHINRLQWRSTLPDNTCTRTPSSLLSCMNARAPGSFCQSVLGVGQRDLTLTLELHAKQLIVSCEWPQQCQFSSYLGGYQTSGDKDVSANPIISVDRGGYQWSHSKIQRRTVCTPKPLLESKGVSKINPPRPPPPPPYSRRPKQCIHFKKTIVLPTNEKYRRVLQRKEIYCSSVDRCCIPPQAHVCF